MNYAPDDIERCPAHPDALVRRELETTYYTLNQIETHKLQQRVLGYSCSVCGRILQQKAASRAE